MWRDALRRRAAIRELRRALRPPDVERALAAIDILVELEPNQAAFATLVEALSCPEPDIRETAVLALTQFGNPSAIGPFLRCFADPTSDSGTRQAVIQALGETAFLDPRSIGTLSQALADEDENIRGFAARSLGYLTEHFADHSVAERLLPQFVAAARDSSRLVREGAIEALGRLRHPDALPALAEALGSADLLIRRCAALALARVGTPDAGSLLEALATDVDPVLRSIGENPRTFG